MSGAGEKVETGGSRDVLRQSGRCVCWVWGGGGGGCIGCVDRDGLDWEMQRFEGAASSSMLFASSSADSDARLGY